MTRLQKQETTDLPLKDTMGPSKKNKFGLPRHIPEEIRSQVRLKCHFACVVCREIPVDYDHFAPPFKKARRHTVDGIALLCLKHHGLRTKGMMPDDVLIRKLADLATSSGAPVKLDFDFPGTPVDWRLKIGHLRLRQGTKFSVNGRSVFQVEPNEQGGALISAQFCDHRGNAIASIEQNAFEGNSASVADLVTTGNRVAFTTKDRTQRLVAVIDGNNRIIEISEMDMFYSGARLIVDQGRFELGIFTRTGWKNALGGGPFGDGDNLMDINGDMRLIMMPPSNPGGSGAFMLTGETQNSEDE